MNKYHSEILEEIKKKARSNTSFHSSFNYSGSSHPRYGLSVPGSRQIAKTWASNHENISLSELLELLTSLYQGESTDEKKIAGQILQYLPSLRVQVEPKLLDNWLNELEGWEEIDSLCQSVFTNKDMLSQWVKWQKLLSGFSTDTNLAKKRASIVLLTAPVRRSNDENLTNLAFENIDRLKIEKNILITKALSWLLRELVRNHRVKVHKYLEANANTLPKIAIRETKNKLVNGKK